MRTQTREIENAKIIYRDEYPLEEFLKGQTHGTTRWRFCYEYRLKETARATKGKGSSLEVYRQKHCGYVLSERDKFEKRIIP